MEKSLQHLRDCGTRVFHLALILLANFVLTPAVANNETRLALVIGNSSYKYTTALANPRRDASAVAEVLRRLDFEVITGIDLDAPTMKQTIRQFAGKLESAEVALFYYAGHGLQVSGENFLVPIDARLASEIDLEFEATNLKLILRLMDRNSKTSLVFLDACRDNPLAGNLSRSMGLQRSAAIGQGLARVESGIGTFVAYATQPGNYALDGRGRHSPFTAALLAHLETPDLGVGQLMQRVRNSVLQQTKGKQVPWDHSSLTGEFYFKRALPQSNIASASPPAGTPKATGPSHRQSADLLFWESVRNSDNAADLSAYLAQFPSGIFTALARNQLKKLGDSNRVAAKQPDRPIERRTPPAQNTRMSPPLPSGSNVNFAADREAIEEAIAYYLDVNGDSDNCWNDADKDLGGNMDCNLEKITQIDPGEVIGNTITVVSRYTLQIMDTRAFESTFTLLKDGDKYRVIEMRPK